MYLNNKKSARSHPKAKAFGVSRALFLNVRGNVRGANLGFTVYPSYFGPFWAYGMPSLWLRAVCRS